MIVGTFYTNMSKLESGDVLELIWNIGNVKATFDTCFDDCDDGNESDEFTSFVFVGKSFEGNPPIERSDNNYFIVNYRNFPERILLNGEQIN